MHIAHVEDSPHAWDMGQKSRPHVGGMDCFEAESDKDRGPSLAAPPPVSPPSWSLPCGEPWGHHSCQVSTHCHPHAG